VESQQSENPIEIKVIIGIDSNPLLQEPITLRPGDRDFELLFAKLSE
jgi:hypothetical protein